MIVRVSHGHRHVPVSTTASYILASETKFTNSVPRPSSRQRCGGGGRELRPSSVRFARWPDEAGSIGGAEAQLIAQCRTAQAIPTAVELNTGPMASRQDVSTVGTSALGRMQDWHMLSGKRLTDEKLELV